MDDAYVATRGGSGGYLPSLLRVASRMMMMIVVSRQHEDDMFNGIWDVCRLLCSMDTAQTWAGGWG